MSNGVNKVILIGYLGQEPKVSQTTSGILVANISIAVSESRKDPSTGNYVSKTEWVRCVLFNNLAKITQDWLHKGSQVYIEGKLQTRQYTDKNNIQRSTTEVVVNDLTMLGGNPNSQKFGNQHEFAGNAPMNQDFNVNSMGAVADPFSPSNAQSFCSNNYSNYQQQAYNRNQQSGNAIDGKPTFSNNASQQMPSNQFSTFVQNQQMQGSNQQRSADSFGGSMQSQVNNGSISNSFGQNFSEFQQHDNSNLEPQGFGSNNNSVVNDSVEDDDIPF